MTRQSLNELLDRLAAAEMETNRLYGLVKKRRAGTGLQVSDHALVRYLDRVKGLDVRALCSEIITPELVRLYTILGDGELPNGIARQRCVIKNGVIVTILT